MRYSILDGFRGFFLVFMAVVHVNEIFGVTLGKLNHHYAGWVEDAQGFVFLSGLVVGLHYGKLLIKRSYRDMSQAIWRRVRTIYSHQLGLIMIFSAAAASLALLDPGAHPTALAPYSSGDPVFLLSSVLLVDASMHMGILPMYIYFMIFSPPVLLAFHRGLALPVAFLCILIWFVAQVGLIDVVQHGVESGLAAAGYTTELGIFFNVFGWQIIFFAGLFLGHRVAIGRLDLSPLREATHFYAFLVALGAIVFFAIFDRVVFWSLISDEYSRSVLTANQRQNFSLVYFVNFAAVLYAVTWIVVAGPECGVRWLSTVARRVRWLFTRQFLVFLGQHSLHVFSFHILLVYLLACIFDGEPVSEAFGSLILITSVASLYLPAIGHAWLQRRSAASTGASRRLARVTNAESEVGPPLPSPR